MRARSTLRQLLSFCMLLTSPGALASSGLAAPPEATWEPLEVPGDTYDGLREVALLARASSGPALLVESFEAATEIRQLAGLAFEPVTSVDFGRGAVSERNGNFYVCTGPDIVVRRWDGRSWSNLGGAVTLETGFKSRRGYFDCSITFDRTGAPLVVWQSKPGAKLRRTSAARWDGEANRWIGLNDTLSTGQAAYFEIDPRSEAGIVLAYEVNGIAATRRVVTRVYRWDGNALSQLGSDSDLTGLALAVAVHQQTPYVALADTQGDAQVRGLYGWADTHWDRVASVPAGLLKLAFTLGGRPLTVAQELTGDGQSEIALSVLDGATSQRLAVLPIAPGASVGSLDVDVDASGRPVVAWTEPIAGLAADNPASRVKAVRLSVPVP